MDRNLAPGITRSMNAELKQGAVDGLVMRLRPNTSLNTDTASAEDRADHLGDQFHGNMGEGAPAAADVIYDYVLR